MQCICIKCQKDYGMEPIEVSDRSRCLYEYELEHTRDLSRTSRIKVPCEPLGNGLNVPPYSKWNEPEKFYEHLDQQERDKI